jgi:hypothetical protein
MAGSGRGGARLPGDRPNAVTRAAGQPVQAVEVTGSVPVGITGQPPPLTFKPATAAAGATMGAFTVTAAAGTRKDSRSTSSGGQGARGNVDRIVTGPAVT